MKHGLNQTLRLVTAGALTGCLPVGGGHMGGMMGERTTPQDSDVAMRAVAGTSCRTVIREIAEGAWRVTLTMPWVAPKDSLLYFVDVRPTHADASATGSRVTLVVRSLPDTAATPAVQTSISALRTEGRYPFAPSLPRRGRYRAIVTVRDTTVRASTVTLEQEIAFDGCDLPTMPSPKRTPRTAAALSWIGVGAVIMGVMMARGIR